MSDAKPPRHEDLPPDQIAEDPARFQSRAAYPRDWMDQDLDDVEFYNVDFAGVISVWRDPEDEKLYVIDGHRRLRLAKRLQAPSVHVQFLEASSDADAFARGVELSLGQWRSSAGMNCVGPLKVVERRSTGRCTRAGSIQTASRQIDCTSSTQTWEGDIPPSRTITKRRKESDGHHEQRARR